MRTKVLVVVLAIALAVVASVVLAQGGNAPQRAPGMGLGGGMGLGAQIMQELDLTQDQIQQMRQLHQDFFNNTQGLRNQLQTKMQELAQLWSDDATAAQLKAKLTEIDPIKKQLRDAGIDFALQARNILTVEQRTKLKEIIKNRPGYGTGVCCGLGMGCGMCGLGMGMGSGAGMGGRMMGAPGMGRGQGAGGVCPMAN